MMLPRTVWDYENNYMGVMEDRSIDSTWFPSDESEIVKWAWKAGGVITTTMLIENCKTMSGESLRIPEPLPMAWGYEARYDEPALPCYKEQHQIA